MKATPTGGTRAFRNKASIAVDHGALVVTDRKGQERRFPLNSGPASPAQSIFFSPDTGPSQWGIVDGHGEVLAVGWIGDWDSTETELVDRAAGLTPGIQSRLISKEDLRHDGVILEDGTWWRLAPTAGSVAFLLALITQVGVVPAALGWPVVAVLMAYLVVGMTSGAYGKHRRGKGAAVQDAIVAGDDDAYKKARDEALNPSKSNDPDPPEAAT